MHLLLAHTSSLLLRLYYVLIWLVGADLLTRTAALQAAYDDYGYPLHIPSFRLRKDAYSGEQVSRGRISLLVGLLMHSPPKSYDAFKRKVTFEEFNKLLQCAPVHPILHNKLSSLHQITKQSIQLVAAFIESECRPWSVCRNDIVPKYLQGKYPPTLGNRNTQRDNYWQGARMYRVMNGTLFLDWPWGRERFSWASNPHLTPFFYVLSLISNIKNSVFLMAEETSALPWDISFPSFGCSPRIDSGDMPCLLFGLRHLQMKSLHIENIYLITVLNPRWMMKSI